MPAVFPLREVDPVASAALATEVAARAAADLLKQDAASAATDVELAAEAAARAASEATIAGSVSDEAAARAAADSVEASARIAGDSALDTRVTSNTSNIATNASAISAETSRATTAEATKLTKVPADAGKAADAAGGPALSVVSASEVTGNGAVVRGAGFPFIVGQWQLKERRSLSDFSNVPVFVGNDDTTVMQTALVETMAEGRMLHLPEGVAGASATLVSSLTSNLFVRGAGKGLTILEHGAASSPLLQLQGTLTSVTTMPSGAAIGATQIVVGSTAGLSKGSLLYLRDPAGAISGEDVSGGSLNVTVAVPGEVVRVYSVDDGTHLTLYGRLCWNYGTSSDVRLLTAPTCDISGFTIRNPSNVGDATTARGVLLNFCQNVQIRDLAAEKMAGAFIYLQGVAGGRINGIDGYESQDLEVPGNNPYLIIAARATVHLLITGCRQRGGRHLFTTGSTATDIPAQHILIAHSIASHMSQAGFDSHPGSRWINFYADMVIQSLSHGFQLRGPDNSVTGGTVNGAVDGVYAVNGADRAKVTGLRAQQVDYGVHVKDSEDVMIGGHSVLDAAINGVLVDAPTSAWAGHMTRFDLDDTRIAGTPSGAAVSFGTGAWQPGFRIGPGVRIPDAATKVSGAAFPDATAASTIAVAA